jgi:cathepsin L
MKPYQMVSSASQQPFSFYLGSYNYTDIPDVLNQLTCGSCYAFSTASSLSSVYSQKTGQHVTFSPQYIMDCVPYDGMGGGSGCWGGFPGLALDFIIDVGGIIPVQLDYPYAGVQGRCDT